MRHFWKYYEQGVIRAVLGKREFRPIVLGVLNIAFLMAAVLGGAFTVYVFVAIRDLRSLYLLIACWALAPPMWFLIEYAIGRCTPGIQMEHLRHAQHLAAALWAGVLVTLLAVASSPIVKNWPACGL